MGALSHFEVNPRLIIHRRAGRLTQSSAGGNGGQTRFVKLDFGLKSPDEYVTDGGGGDCGHAGFILRRRLEVVPQNHERSNEREKW